MDYKSALLSGYNPIPFIGPIINVIVAFISMVFEYSILIISSPFFLYFYLEYRIKNTDKKSLQKKIMGTSNLINSIGDLFQVLIHTILLWSIFIIFSPVVLIVFLLKRHREKKLKP